MNIFIFCTAVAFGKGGMEKVAANLANFLSESTSWVVTLGFQTRPDFKEPVYEVSKKVILAPWERADEARGMYAKRILEAKPDVFLYFSTSPQTAHIISLIHGSGIPIIIHEGSNPERIIETNWATQRKVNRYQAAWEREAVYSQASAIRFTMEDYKKSIPPWLRERSMAFPNAFEIPERCSPLSSKKIINIGGLKKNKNIIPLLYACHNVFKNFPEWSLHVYSATNKNLAGKKYLEEVENLISNLDLEKNIFLHGEVNDIYGEFFDSSIHVITSLAEGLSNAVCEAMCCGVPTVGIKNVFGVDGLVKYNNGLLADRENIENTVANKIILLIRDEELRKKMGLQARNDAQIFAPNIVYGNWLVLLNNAVENKAAKCIHPAQRHYSRSIVSLYKELVPKYDNYVDSFEKTMANLGKRIKDLDFEKKEALLMKKRGSYDF
jgi:glycosyltransferase involved in cell wall biosynthesis